MEKIYVAFIHRWSNGGGHGLLYLGCFSTRENAERYCRIWNRYHETDKQFADFICEDQIDRVIEE